MSTLYCHFNFNHVRLSLDNKSLLTYLLTYAATFAFSMNSLRRRCYGLPPIAMNHVTSSTYWRNSPGEIINVHYYYKPGVRGFYSVRLSQVPYRSEWLFAADHSSYGECQSGLWQVCSTAFNCTMVEYTSKSVCLTLTGWPSNRPLFRPILS